MDLANTARMQLDARWAGNGNFAMVVTGLIAASVYGFFCIIVASLHIMEQVEQMNRQMDGANCILRWAQRV